MRQDHRALLELEDHLIDDLPSLVALRISFSRGLFDRMPVHDNEVEASDPGGRGDKILIALLENAGVVARDGGCWKLTADFSALLELRGEALRRRCDFVALAACDLLMGGEALLFDLPAFMAQSATFGFFRYERARSTGAANLEDTKPWAAYVTALSEREGPELAPILPLAGARRLLEVGGNTGAFALEVLDEYPTLDVTILDLPAVCRIGEDYVTGRPSAERLRFHAGDAKTDPLPEVAGGPPDAILFKSVLHDWRESEARALLAKAARHLAPGGVLIVCERGPVEYEASVSGLSAAANLVFAPFYREAAAYEAMLGELGLTALPTRTRRLEMTFYSVAARKAKGPS
jgi:SAM-dependent methyltransferase